MIFNWLTKIFPKEIGQAWRLIRQDLPLWVGVSILLAATGVLSPSVPAWLAVLTSTTVAMVVLVIIPLIFDARGRAEPTPRPDLQTIAAALIAKSPSLLLWGALVFAIITLAKALVIAAVSILIDDVTTRLAVAVAASWVVHVSLLLRFIFVPFLVVLEGKQNLADTLKDGGPFGRFATVMAWPLLASDRLGSAVRWRILPYLILVGLGPTIVSSLTVPLQPLASTAWQLFSLTAAAAVFEHYRTELERHGIRKVGL